MEITAAGEFQDVFISSDFGSPFRFLFWRNDIDIYPIQICIYIYIPEKGWNESQRLFCDSRMSGTEPTNDPMVRNGNIALLAKWAVEPKTRL